MFGWMGDGIMSVNASWDGVIQLVVSVRCYCIVKTLCCGDLEDIYDIFRCISGGANIYRNLSSDTDDTHEIEYRRDNNNNIIIYTIYIQCQGLFVGSALYK